MTILTLLLLNLILVFLIILSVNFKWCVNTIREIADSKNRGGYTKLVQIGITSMVIIIFVGIIIYYIIKPAQVDRIDIILTVIVGWLGTIIGKFFGEKAMGQFEEARGQFSISSSRVFDKYQNFADKVMPILHRLDKLKTKLEKK